MIYGLGIDIVDIESFASLLADPHSAFKDVTFTVAEQEYALRAPSRRPEVHLAARFAVKEATVKALAAAFGREGIEPNPVPLGDIEVDRDATGRPGLNFHQTARAAIARLGIDRAHVSISHDGGYAVGLVILERFK